MHCNFIFNITLNTLGVRIEMHSPLFSTRTLKVYTSHAFYVPCRSAVILNIVYYYDESHIMKVTQYICSFVKLVRPQPTRHTVKSSHGPLVVNSSRDELVMWRVDNDSSLTRCMVMGSELLPERQSPHSRWKCAFTKTTLWLLLLLVILYCP